MLTCLKQVTDAATDVSLSKYDPQSKLIAFPMGRKECRHAFKVFLLIICVLSLPSVATGGGGALFTLLSTFAFFEGGLPCRRRKKNGKKMLYDHSVFWNIFCSRKHSLLARDRADVSVFNAKENSLGSDVVI